MSRLRAMFSRTAGFTLLELMVIISMIALIGAIAYPRISDTLRKMRARDGAKAIINSLLIAKAEAMIRNLAYQVTLTPSTTVGSLDRVNGGGSVLVQRSSGTSCTMTALTFIDRFEYAPLSDISLCVIKTTTAGEVTASTSCGSTATNFCVTPDGTVTNMETPTAAFTMAYVRENQLTTSGVQGVGVIRQVVIPRRKAVKVNPIQVTADVCL